MLLKGDVEGSGLNLAAPPPFFHWWKTNQRVNFDRPSAVTCMGFGVNNLGEEVVWLRFGGELWQACLWEDPFKVLEAVSKKQKECR